MDRPSMESSSEYFICPHLHPVSDDREPLSQRARLWAGTGVVVFMQKAGRAMCLPRNNFKKQQQYIFVSVLYLKQMRTYIGHVPKHTVSVSCLNRCHFINTSYYLLKIETRLKHKCKQKKKQLSDVEYWIMALYPNISGATSSLFHFRNFTTSNLKP